MGIFFPVQSEANKKSKYFATESSPLLIFPAAEGLRSFSACAVWLVVLLGFPAAGIQEVLIGFFLVAEHACFETWTV